MPIQIPTIIEPSDRAGFDLYSRLLQERCVFLTGELNDDKGQLIVAQMLYLELQDPGKPITFYINSPGGYVTSGFGIFDTMNYIACDVETVCIGQAASMGAFLLACGTRGKRRALPHSRIMIHQPLGGAQGRATDIAIHAREILKMRDQLNEILAMKTGKTLEDIRKDTDHDNFMTAEEARAYGIIDEVVARSPRGR